MTQEQGQAQVRGPQPVMNNPAAGAGRAATGSKILLVFPVVFFLLLVRWMASGSAAAGAGSGNPIFGKWIAVAGNGSYCPTQIQFSASSMSQVVAGVKSSFSPVYNAHLGGTVVDVATGNLANYQQWNVTGPDAINWATSNGYGMSVCSYTRK